MSDEECVRALIRRAWDEQAAAELVRRYEPTIRVAARFRLSDPKLRRLWDSMDVCQSVLAKFFVRAASGQFELETPDQLLKLLVTMARNKPTNYALQEQAARRNRRRVQADSPTDSTLVDPGPSASQTVANKDLLEECLRHLPATAQRLADQRALGRSWEEIGAELGEKPDTLRMRFKRALDRVARELTLEE